MAFQVVDSQPAATCFNPLITVFVRNDQDAFATTALRRLDRESLMPFNQTGNFFHLRLLIDHPNKSSHGNIRRTQCGTGQTFVIHQWEQATWVITTNVASVALVHPQHTKAGQCPRGNK